MIEGASAGRFHRSRQFQNRAHNSGKCRNEYPGITLISVTQKIASVTDYDQIILLMEGEVLATGTHGELMQTSPEYVKSTFPAQYESL